LKTVVIDLEDIAKVSSYVFILSLISLFITSVQRSFR
jgi:hypothetical protein